MRLKIIGPAGEVDLKVKPASAAMLVNQLRGEGADYMTLNDTRMLVEEARVQFTTEDAELVANVTIVVRKAPTEIYLGETE